MHRYPELAHRVGFMDDVMEAKHLAIDKITALNIASQALNRLGYDPVTEIVKEERMASLISDAHYYWQQYVTLKLKRYEELLQTENNEKSAVINDQQRTIEKGNALIDKHSRDLDSLKQERGI